jgi:hypothetical protein
LTNRIAFFLGLFVALAISGDILLNDGTALVFTMRKFVDLVEWVAFWR